MSWIISLTQSHESDQKYGEDQCAVGYAVDGAFVLQEDALDSICNRSYDEHFGAHPEDLEELIGLAKRLRNPRAEATTGVDLQVPAIMAYLERHRLRLQGGNRRVKGTHIGA
jgi:hypothetical protein